MQMECNYSVPLFEKEGLGEILLDKSPSLCSPPFSKGEVNTYDGIAIYVEKARNAQKN
jgi:hypothetical protein